MIPTFRYVQSSENGKSMILLLIHQPFKFLFMFYVHKSTRKRFEHRHLYTITQLRSRVQCTGIFNSLV